MVGAKKILEGNMISKASIFTAGIFLLFAWIWAGPLAYAEDCRKYL
jgi:hypothetical protein